MNYYNYYYYYLTPHVLTLPDQSKALRGSCISRKGAQIIDGFSMGRLYCASLETQTETFFCRWAGQHTTRRTSATAVKNSVCFYTETSNTNK